MNYRLPGGDGCLKRAKSADKPSRPYVKKPLNAFMLYMKEQRAQVVAECTLKESAAINQILGRKVSSCRRGFRCYLVGILWERLFVYFFVFL